MTVYSGTGRNRHIRFLSHIHRDDLVYSFVSQADTVRDSSFNLLI